MFNNREKEREEYDRWVRYGHERGWFEKSKDQLAAWFGDEDAEQRRRLDKTEHDRLENPRLNEGYEPTPYRPRYDRQSSTWRGYESENSAYRRYNENPSHPALSNPNPFMSRYFDDNYQGLSANGRECEFLTPQGGSIAPSYVPAADRYSGRSMERGMRGPRNFRRSDERILDDIHERLDRHHNLDARDVIIDVKDGEVTLKGVVIDRADKRLAEEITENVFGVKNVQNLIRVNHESATQSVLAPSNGVRGLGGK